MKTEIEAKFLRVNHDEIREQLRSCGAECVQPMRLMRRMTFDNVSLKAKGAFLRVRDEGDRVTMTYKQFDSLSLHGAKEIEIVVSSFEDTTAILHAVHDKWLRTSLQESRREAWRHGEVEIVLDEWPWLEPYIEIEGPDEARVRATAQALGMNWENAVFGDVMSAYRAQYPHLGENDTVGNLHEVRFDMPPPPMFDR